MKVVVVFCFFFVLLILPRQAYAQAGEEFIPLLHTAGSGQSIASISPTLCTGNAGGACATISVTMSPPSPSFSGTQAVVSSGGGCTATSTAGSFSGNVLNLNSGLANGSYTFCDQVAQAGLAIQTFAIAVTVTTSSTTTINADMIAAGNGVSASTLTCPTGTVWSFNIGAGLISPTAGEYHVLRNGSGQDPDPTYGGWEITCSGSTPYAFNAFTLTWYSWSGSAWVNTGAAPPWSGSTIPIYMGNQCCGDDIPFVPWLGRQPNYGDNYSRWGPWIGYSPAQYPSPNNGGSTVGPVDITADMFSDPNGSGYCTGPNGDTFADTPSGLSAEWSRIAANAGNVYSNAINSAVQSQLVPLYNAGILRSIRVNHEWDDDWSCWSPWYGTTYSGAFVSGATWVAATQLLTNAIRTYLPGVIIEQDGPMSTTEEAYYLGDANVDSMGYDIYMETTSTGTGHATLVNASNGGESPNGGGGRNFEVMASFAAAHNKYMEAPEWGDYSGSTTGDGGLITAIINMFYSYSLGPGHMIWAAASYWDQPLGSCVDSGGCSLGDISYKENAYKQAAPSGFGNTSYNGLGAWSSSASKMPCPTFWATSGECPALQ